MAKRKKDASPLPALEKICAASIGVNIIALIQLVGLTTLNARLSVAVLFFATSLPPLGFLLARRILEPSGDDRLDAFLVGAGTAGTVIGMAALIFHLSIEAGVIFSFLSLVSWIMLIRRV